MGLKTHHWQSSEHFLYFCGIPRKSNHFWIWPQSAELLHTHTHTLLFSPRLPSLLFPLWGYYRAFNFVPEWTKPTSSFLSLLTPKSVHLSPIFCILKPFTLCPLSVPSIFIFQEHFSWHWLPELQMFTWYRCVTAFFRVSSSQTIICSTALV